MEEERREKLSINYFILFVLIATRYGGNHLVIYKASRLTNPVNLGYIRFQLEVIW